MIYQTLISAQRLANHMTDPGWVIVDCRFSLADVDAGYKAYLAGHLPNARYAHLNRDLSGEVTEQTGRHPLPDVEAFCHVLGRLGIAPRTQVVVYDDVGGAMAARLWWLLRWVGHRSVALLDGGWQAWLKRDGLVQQKIPPAVAANYPGRQDNGMWLNADQVMSGLENDSILLLDARAPERFAGEVEPIDPVAGHVCGAQNRPYQSNLDEHGFFKSPERLTQEFQSLLKNYTAPEVVHMCGSGVTACHNLLAMETAGLTGSRLYPGSWSEWLCDPQRPAFKK